MAAAVLVAAALPLAALPAAAKPELLVDVDTGRVLHAEDATRTWYPASLTKLMTVYVTLNAIRAGRVTRDTVLTYSKRASEEKPSKWGLPVGTKVTIDNALKMMIVKSANDIAVMIAEGVDGSVEKFVAEMNATAARLGMTQTHFVNPNGWWNADHYSSARDMAILALALLHQYPQSVDLFDIRALKLGKRVVRGHNRLLGHYPGAEGMKTGFTCPSGFNLVALAQRGHRRLLAVVMGYDSARRRDEAAARLLTEGFGAFTFWRVGESVRALQPVPGGPPNLRSEVCTREHTPVADGDDGEPAVSGLVASGDNDSGLLKDAPAPVPVPIFLGPNPKAPKPRRAGAPLRLGEIVPQPMPAPVDRGAR
jgi:D-alanyl-D-alanine carboxypeptidase